MYQDNARGKGCICSLRAKWYHWCYTISLQSCLHLLPYETPFNLLYDFVPISIDESYYSQISIIFRRLIKLVMAAFGTYIGFIAMLLLLRSNPKVCALPIRHTVNDDLAMAWSKSPKDAQSLSAAADAFPMITEVGGQQTFLPSQILKSDKTY